MRTSRPCQVVQLLAIIVVALCLSCAPGHAALTGIIAGSVKDIKTNAPLSGANVTLTPVGYTAVTDAMGTFLFTAVPPGNYTVAIGLVGYTDQEIIDVAVTQDFTTRIEVNLAPEVVEVSNAVATVTGARVNLHPEQTGSSYVVTAEDEHITLSQPNDRYQFPGLVFTQPGVVPDSTFFPHIRGARSNQVGYMIDGIPIVEPNNNVFATNIVTVGLNRLELLTGGWDAQYGSQVGGVLNEVVKRGDQVRGGFVEFGFGTPTALSQMVFERGDTGTKPGSSYYFAGNIWQTKFPGDDFQSKAPAVLDGLFKGILPISSKDSLTLLANHGFAKYDFRYRHTRDFDRTTGLFVDVPEDMDNANQNYNLDALSLTHKINDNSYWTARVYRHDNHINIHMGSDIFGTFQSRKQSMLGGQFDYVRQMGPNHVLYAGIWQINSKNHWRLAMDMPPVYGPFDQRASNDTRNLQMYLQDTRRIAPRLDLGLGLRYETMTYDRALYGDLDLKEVSPRAGLTYEVVPGKVLLRGSIGKYVQFPPAARTGQRFREGDPFSPYDPESWYMLQEGPSQLKAQEDINRELGLEAKLNSNTLLSLTAFRRTSRQMLQRWAGPTDDTDDYDPNEFSPYPFRFASNGKGQFQGLEMKVDRKMSDNLRAWLSYTRLNAKATTSLENAFPLGISTGDDPDKLFPVDWDQRDTLALAANWKLGKLSVDPWLIWGSGYPYALQSGLDIDPNGGFNYITDGFGNQIPILVNGQPQQESAPNKLRTGANLVVSLNLNYKSNSDTEWFVDIYNLFDRRDVTNFVWYHPDTGAILGLKPPTPEYPYGYIDYVAFTKTLPRSFTIGLRRKF
jgi:outer membrane receptor protein involved in Fe transport